VDRPLELSQTALREMRASLFESTTADESQSHETPPSLHRSGDDPSLWDDSALRLLAAISHRRHPRTVGCGSDTETLFKPESGAKLVEEEGVYRIVQESLNNAVAFTCASGRRSTQKANGQVLNLSISDDGVGFSENRGRMPRREAGLMKTMRER
jgi:signal transduction histidine kinase